MAKKKTIKVECINCNTLYSITYAGKINPEVCAFCSEEIKYYVDDEVRALDNEDELLEELELDEDEDEDEENTEDFEDEGY